MQGKESSVPRTKSLEGSEESTKCGQKRNDQRAIAEYAVTEAKEERGLRRKM